MPGEIITDHISYGKSSPEADTLVVEILSSQISFCEFQSGLSKPLWITHYPFQEQTMLSSGEGLLLAMKHFRLAGKSYNHVYVNYFEKHFTLCPTTFFNDENSRTLLEFNTGSSKEQIIVTDDLNPDIKLIYSIDENLKSTLDRLFPQHQLKHTLTVLSRLMLQSEELMKEDILLIIHDHYIEVVIKKEHKLLLVNQFSVTTEEDVLYYVLFIMEQYQLNPLTVNIALAGNIPNGAGIITVLKKYVKSVRLCSGHRSLNWTELSGSPQHYNYTLLNRLFCE